MNEVTRSIYEQENYWRDGKEGTGRGEWLVYTPIQLFIRKLLKHGKLLDVGCGCGPFIQQGDPGDIYGIDFSRFAVTHPLRGAEGKMIYGEVTDIPFKDNFFHIVTAFNMLEHIDPRTVDTCLDELFRVSSKWVVMMTCLSEDYKPALEYEYWGEGFENYPPRAQHEITRGHWCLHSREWWEAKIGSRGKVRPDLQKEILSFTTQFLPEEDQAWTFKSRSLMVYEKGAL